MVKHYFWNKQYLGEFLFQAIVSGGVFSKLENIHKFKESYNEVSYNEARIFFHMAGDLLAGSPTAPLPPSVQQERYLEDNPA